MVATAKEVGKNRYRESYGRYLEDFNIGDIYEHRPAEPDRERQYLVHSAHHESASASF